MRIGLLLLLLVALALPGCSDEFVPCPSAPSDFDGHIKRWFDLEAEMASYCLVKESGSAACKFLIPVFEPSHFDARHVHHADTRGGVEFMDPNFYTLHDEWWWFHLLNGAPLDGCLRVPVVGGKRYHTVQEVYDDLAGRSQMPVGLSMSGDRIYSEEFYMYMLSACFECGYKTKCWNTCPRVMAGGTIAFYPADPNRPVPEAFWAFSVYVDDAIDTWEVKRYFERLRKALPAETAANLRWLARARAVQEAVVDGIRKDGGPLADKVLKVADVVTPGQVTIYNPGVAAGQIRRVADGASGAASLGKHDIVILESVPDELPPVAAILTAEPQTAQAHLNLLAKARGTPNAFASGAFEDQILQEWRSDSAWLAVRMEAGSLSWRPLSDSEAKHYLEMLSTGLIQVPWIKLEGAPLWVDLSAQTTPASVAVDLVGGKVAGLRALFAVPDVVVPYQPMAITVSGYGLHMEAIKPLVNALLNDPTFQSSAYVRYIMLEGRAAFQQAHAGDISATAWLKNWTKKVPSLPPLLLAAYNAGGLKEMIRGQALDPAWRAKLREKLLARFADLSPKQGLRFRSSATVEDIEGFNGAGIYASNTGWLDPAAAGKSKKSTVERAIVRTWSSYWSFAAFTERRAANIDHMTGRMAVLVHPRFDGSLEAANGVVLVRLARRADGARRIITEVNAQMGSVSVTNPEREGALPEVDHIIQEPGKSPVLKRLQASSEVKKGEYVLSDEELMAMHKRVVAVAQQWLVDINADLPAARKRLTLQLDLEFRKVHPGWPALASGEALPERIVYKQSRTLMPVFGVASSDLKGLIAPADLIAAAVKVERRTCKANGFVFEAIEFTTAPSANVFEHHDSPFLARIRVRLTDGLPSGGLPADSWHQGSHLALASFAHPKFGKVGYRVELSLTEEQSQAWGWRALVVEHDGAWSVSGSKGALLSGSGVSCQIAPVKQSVKDWLASLFEPL